PDRILDSNMFDGFSGDGTRLARAEGSRALLLDLSADERPLPELLAGASLLASRELSHGGLLPLGPNRYRQGWERADADTANVKGIWGREWHRRQVLELADQQENAPTPEGSRTMAAALLWHTRQLPREGLDDRLRLGRGRAHVLLRRWEEALE